MFWISVVIFFIFFFYYTLIKPLNYWTKRGVKQSNPLPLVGDNLAPLVGLKSFAEFLVQLYEIAPNARYAGIYQFQKPALMLRDPDLIKTITVKEFDHFMDHLTFIPEDVDPLWSKNLFGLTGQKWRDMRSKLSTSFTSSKMKQMFVLINENAEQFAKFYLQKKNATIDMKDVFRRFANDVIASTAFGIKVDSLSNPENEFYEMGRKTTDLSGFWKNLKFFGFIICPKLYKILGIRLFPQDVKQFFINIIKESIEFRQKNNIVRPDFINLMMEISQSEENKSKTVLTDEDFLAQALIFFFAGFDTVSSLMAFTSYEIGIHPEVQQKLRQEVDQVLQDNQGKLTYESLLGMKYLDMVLSESLRKWPNTVGTDRVCTKPYTIQPTTSEERPLSLEKGQVVFLPIFALHHDSKFFPYPQRFDPERFSEENKSKIVPYSYFPFGIGPRNCIGSRFALLETKALFFHLLANFEIVPVKETRIPLKIQRKSVHLGAEGGIWLGLKRRTK